MKKKNITTAVALIVGLAAGGFLGYFAKPIPNDSIRGLRENNKDYHFINPLLAVDRGDTKESTPLSTSIDNKVQSFINQQVAGSNISTASVYFIDYGKNNFFSINENAAYNPASLLKVAAMIAYLKESEGADPTLLDKRLTYSANIASFLKQTPFDPPSELTVGSSYTVSDLIDKMIADSDNGALALLTSNISPADLQQVYTDLGLKSPNDSYPAAYTISLKDYSLFFRVLYNGTYLSKADSEKALLILSKATFKDGLEKGIPAGTQIAHKFGEYVQGQDNVINTIELHDCGIVYSAKNTYFLCVMTRGNNFQAVSNAIGGISKIVYDTLSANQ